MMKRMKAFSVLLLLTTISSCKLPKEGQKAVPLKASCDIQAIDLSQIECIDFTTLFTGDSEDICDDAQDRNLGSLKSHKDSASARACLSLDRVARCQLQGYTVHFYEEEYTAGAAQTECSSLGGTFAQN